MRKRKFNPVVYRIKLNPEQAVLFCGCYKWDKQMFHASGRYWGVHKGDWSCITDMPGHTTRRTDINVGQCLHDTYPWPPAVPPIAYAAGYRRLDTGSGIGS